MQLGTDFNSDYNFKDGDILLVSEEDDIIQSVTNRLNTRLGSMDAFYNQYGSYLRTYLGSKRNDTLLRFIQVEINTVLRQDPRLQDATVECEYGNKGEVIVNINSLFDDDSDLTLSLVITEDYGVDISGN